MITINCCCEYGVKKSLGIINYLKYASIIESIQEISFATHSISTDLDICQSDYSDFVCLKELQNAKEYYVPISYINLLKISQPMSDMPKVNALNNILTQNYSDVCKIKLPKSQDCCVKCNIISYLQENYCLDSDFEVQFNVNTITSTQITPQKNKGKIIALDSDVVFLREDEENTSNIYIIPLCNIINII